MTNISAIIIPVVSVLCALFTILFFWRYGIFKHPWYATLLIVFSASIPSIMVIGVLPYDISTCLFGNTGNNGSALKTSLEVLYWISFVLSWVINPLIVSYLSYSNTISLKHRIWMTVRENLIFYAIVLGLAGIGIIILIASNKLTISSIFPLAIALANGYGLLLLCLCLGYAFISLPRDLWLMASPSFSYIYSLNEISKEAKRAARTIADGDAVLLIANRARSRLNGLSLDMFMQKGIQRIDKLNLVKGSLPIPETYFVTETKNKKIKKFDKFDWKYCSTGKLEDFLSIMDTTIESIVQSSSFLDYSGKTALRALKRYQNQSIMSKILLRIFAVILGIINAICFWSEICLMFKNKLSLFYQLSHVNMKQSISIIFVSTPILTYLLVIGSWSLMKFKLGSFYKFIVSATSANTMNYFANFLCRLAPTIGFHYMQQIGAESSQFQKVMGVMDVVVFIGDKWNIFSPIILIIIALLVTFRISDKIRLLFGCDEVVFESDYLDYDNLQNGEQILKDLEPDAKEIIESGLTFKNVLDKTMPSKAKYEMNERLSRSYLP